MGALTGLMPSTKFSQRPIFLTTHHQAQHYSKQEKRHNYSDLGTKHDFNMSQPNRSTGVQNTKKREQATESQHQQPYMAASTPEERPVGSKDKRVHEEDQSAEAMTEEECLNVASEANVRTVRALTLIDQVEQERFDRPLPRGAPAPASLDRLRARVLAANAEDASSSRLGESHGKGRDIQGSAGAPATKHSSGYLDGIPQAPGAQLQLLQNRGQYEQTMDYRANGHQKMFDSLGERAETRQNLTGVHRFNLPVETMDYMISVDKALLRSDDDDVDMDMNPADDSSLELAFSTPPTPFSVERAQMELARIDSVRAQMAVNEAKRYLNHIEEADRVSQRQKMRLTHPRERI